MQTLFEVMQNSETLSRYMSDEKSLIKSIQWHLSKLLNTRQGSMVHLSDYGIPDISQIYLTMPQSVHSFIEEVKNVIEKYETRLKEIQVSNIRYHVEKAIISFELSGRTIMDNDILLKTNFLASGRAAVFVQEEQE